MGKMDAVGCPTLQGERKYCPRLARRDKGGFQVAGEVVANEDTRARSLDAKHVISGINSDRDGVFSGV